MTQAMTRHQYLAQQQAEQGTEEARRKSFAHSIEPLIEAYDKTQGGRQMLAAPAPLTLADYTAATETSLRRIPPEQEVKGDFLFLIDSAKLGCQVIICGEAADVDLWRMQHPGVDVDVPVYQGVELLEIAKSGCPSRLMNEVKTVFGGRVLMDGEETQKARVK